LALVASWLLCLVGCSDPDSPRDHAADREAVAPDAASSDSADEEDDGPCAGRSGKLRGHTMQTVQVGDVARSFVLYAPENLDAHQPAPLVIAAHGFAMTGDTMYKVTGFAELAEQEGFVAVFPEGASFGKPWNVGTGTSGSVAGLNSPTDDQAFIDAIMDFVDDDQCLDRSHVFVTGFSMGGYFANETGCLRTDLAGIAPHSGGSHDLSACPGAQRPVILFHGMVDGVVQYEANALVTRDRWLARNGCSAEFEAESVEGGSCEYYKGCAEHAQVALCHFDEMEHKWAGGNDPTYWYGDPDRASAAQLAWKFWRTYAWD
jgi:polyhydroxybutyrate depolymerase